MPQLNDRDEPMGGRQEKMNAKRNHDRGSTPDPTEAVPKEEDMAYKKRWFIIITASDFT